MGPLISNAASSNGGTTIAGSGSVTWSTDGSGLVDEESRQQLSQWLTRATAWSSVFPDPDGAWNASHILGPPDFFPSYGDSGLAWSGRITGDEEWIEVGFDTPVYITALEVYVTPLHIYTRDTHLLFSCIFVRKPVRSNTWLLNKSPHGFKVPGSAQNAPLSGRLHGAGVFSTESRSLRAPL
jgi:hypothetical protein